MITGLKHLFSGAAKYATAKVLLSSTDQSNARVNVCNTCDLLDSARRCGICRCFVDQKAKYESEFCPLASVTSISGTAAAERESLVLTNKWNQLIKIEVPAGFTRIGEVVAFPRHSQVLNLRTNEPAVLLREPVVQ